MKYLGRWTFRLAASLVLGGALIAARPSSYGQSAPARSAASPATQASLTVTGATGQTFTIDGAQLGAMERKTITVHNGHSGADETYEGVPLISLLDKAGAPARPTGKGASIYVLAEGSDHYRALLSLTEAMPAFHPGDVLIADRLNGQPLPTDQGPFKLVVSEDKHPARWVRNLVSIRLVQAP
jgi:DMSO/TMAO reductase YedYZ molybdopterin-dependent catalytic subunit